MEKERDILMSKIPKIIHRTIPFKTTEIMDKCYASWVKHNPSWTIKAHIVPPNKKELYPIVGAFLDKCLYPEYQSDLIRLEVLWNEGGIYLDSDVILYKPLDDFLIDRPFIIPDNGAFLSNAVIGAPPKHPAILQLIYETIDRLNNDKIAHGPFIVTKCWKNRPDIKIYPAETFNNWMFEDGEYEKSDRFDKRWIYGTHLFAGNWARDMHKRYPDEIGKLAYYWEKPEEFEQFIIKYKEW